VSGSGISPAPHHSVFYRPDALPAAQPTASKHWRHLGLHISVNLGRQLGSNSSNNFATSLVKLMSPIKILVYWFFSLDPLNSAFSYPKIFILQYINKISSKQSPTPNPMQSPSCNPNTAFVCARGCPPDAGTQVVPIFCQFYASGPTHWVLVVIIVVLVFNQLSRPRPVHYCQLLEGVTCRCVITGCAVAPALC